MNIEQYKYAPLYPSLLFIVTIVHCSLFTARQQGRAYLER